MTFLILLLPYILSQFFRAFLAVVAGDLGRDLALGPSDLGGMSAAWFWAFAAAQLPLGYALDRAGPRRTLSLTMSSAVAGSIWLAVAGDRLDAFGAMALIGVGCSPILMAGYYMIARLYPARQFALMSSLLLGLGALGDPLSATPLALAVATFGWRSAMLGIAGVTGIAAGLVFGFLRDPARISQGPAISFTAGIARIAMIRALWPILPLTLVGYGVVIALRGLWIAPFLESVHGLGPVARAHAALAMGFAVGFGAMLYGPAERLFGGPKRTAVSGTLATAAALLALSAYCEASPLLATILLAGVGFFGTTYAIVMAHGRSFMPTSLLGRGVTFMNFVFMGGAGLVQAASGRFVEWAGAAGHPPAAIFARLHLGGALLLLAALVIYGLAPAAPAAEPADHG